MSEDQTEYKNRSINHDDLLSIANVICKIKLDNNKHKPNPLEYSFDRLEERQIEECNEMIEAYHVWLKDKSEENTTNFVYEIADRINFLIFSMAKVLGYKELERG